MLKSIKSKVAQGAKSVKAKVTPDHRLNVSIDIRGLNMVQLKGGETIIQNNLIDMIEVRMVAVPRIGEKIVALESSGRTFYGFVVTDVNYSAYGFDARIVVEPINAWEFGYHVRKSGLSPWHSATREQQDQFADKVRLVNATR